MYYRPRSGEVGDNQVGAGTFVKRSPVVQADTAGRAGGHQPHGLRQCGDSVSDQSNRGREHRGRQIVAGQRVDQAAQLGTVGSTGNSTGPHLHIEVVDPSGTKINPKPWLDANGFRYT